MNNDLNYIMTKYDKFIFKGRDNYTKSLIRSSKEITRLTFHWDVPDWKKFRETVPNYFRLQFGLTELKYKQTKLKLIQDYIKKL